MKMKDIGWMAGIIEADGNISLARGVTPRINVSMSDLDTIQKVADMFGSKVLVLTSHKKLPGREHHKTMYRSSVGDRRAASWLMTLFSFLSHRRKMQASKAIMSWRNKKRKDTHVSLEQPCKRGHLQRYRRKSEKVRCRGCDAIYNAGQQSNKETMT